MPSEHGKKINIDELSRNFGEILEKSREIMEEYTKSLKADSAHVPATSLSAATAFMEVLKKLAERPEKVIEAQLELWLDYIKLLNFASKRFTGQPAKMLSDIKDKRFGTSAWHESLTFDFIRQSYLLASDWLLRNFSHVEGLDEKTARKAEFYMRQFVDALSPSNFVMTNPDVLRETMESNGENLVRGLENMLEDLKKGRGHFAISQTDENAFAVGKNIAITKGDVIFQNDLIQLIQYAPQTKQVNRTPILMVPAWINKYYILDMRADNSFVNWLVEQGHTVFMVSWANPDEKLSTKTFEDYMKEGPLAALEAIEQATGEKQVNVVSYCLGGTLMAATIAYLTAKGEQSKIKSITYLTTLVDFSKPGDLGVFIDDLQLDELKDLVKKKGYFPGQDMALIFSMLRSRELIWSFVINNYLLGKEPFPFDLLYWNSDSTRLPAKMHIFYLESMYKNNLLVKPGSIKLGGVGIDIFKNALPTYILSTKEDHIAPWKSTYAATQIYKGPVRFVLSGSGHVAGVVNPPAKQKYGFWSYNIDIKDKNPDSADKWLAGAKENHGSWWNDWNDWIKANNFGGGMIPARKAGDGKLKPIEPAPGSYVKVRY